MLRSISAKMIALRVDPRKAEKQPVSCLKAIIAVRIR